MLSVVRSSPFASQLQPCSKRLSIWSDSHLEHINRVLYTPELRSALTMFTQLAFIEVGDEGKSSASQRAAIRSHVMKGRNKREGSRRSLREANLKAKTLPVASSVAPLVGPVTQPLREDLSVQASSVNAKLGDDSDESVEDLQNRANAVARYFQLRQALSPPTGVSSPSTGRDMSPGELLADCEHRA